MGRKRKTGDGLLPRMREIAWRDGKGARYTYTPVGSTKPVNLGHDKNEAIRKVLDMNRVAPETGTLRWVWRLYTGNSTRWARLAEST